MSKQRSTLSKQHSNLLPQTATMSTVYRKISTTMSNEISSFRQKDEISFDTVAENGNNVEATFDIVERIVQLVAFNNVASTLLLV